MELFLPSLFIVALAGICVFIFIPRFSSGTLFLLCLSFFGFALYSHYLMFHIEYEKSPMLETIKSYAGVILPVVIVLALLIASSNLFTNVNFGIKLPNWLHSGSPTKTNQKVFSNVHGYSNIPIERLANLERQL